MFSAGWGGGGVVIVAGVVGRWGGGLLLKVFNGTVNRRDG